MTCPACGWVGLTGHGRLRWAVFGVSMAAVTILFVLELSGVTQLGDAVLGIAITIALLSIGLRLLIRGDRCGACGAAAIYARRAPEL